MRTASIVALTYSDSEAADDALRRVALHFSEEGWRLAGLVQHSKPRPGRSRCDMILEVLASGRVVAISQDRGPNARGCSLVIEHLINAMQLVRTALPLQPDLVILNKFGKTESEGGGFRTLIAETIEAGISLLIAVPYRNLDGWRAFAGDLAHEIALEKGDDPGAEIIKRLSTSRHANATPYTSAQA